MSRLTEHHPEAALLAEINVTPFTDVLLVLLIIFMILASLALPPGFERRLPDCGCSAPMPKTPPRHIDVTVTRRGAILVAGRAVGAQALYPLLAAMHARAPSETVSLFADAKAPYGAVIRVIDAAKAGGIADVAFVVE